MISKIFGHQPFVLYDLPGHHGRHVGLFVLFEFDARPLGIHERTPYRQNWVYGPGVTTFRNIVSFWSYEDVAGMSINDDALLVASRRSIDMIDMDLLFDQRCNGPCHQALAPILEHALSNRYCTAFSLAMDDNPKDGIYTFVRTDAWTIYKETNLPEALSACNCYPPFHQYPAHGISTDHQHEGMVEPCLRELPQLCQTH